jgi:hypothetical protein
MTLDVVKRSKQDPIIWQEVLRRIRQRTHFLAVLAPSTKNKRGIKRPSPWCSWELGVANANQKPCQVLIEEGTDCIDYSMIHGNQFFLPFKRKSADSFRESVKQAIRKFVMGKTQQQM